MSPSRTVSCRLSSSTPDPVGELFVSVTAVMVPDGDTLKPDAAGCTVRSRSWSNSILIEFSVTSALTTFGGVSV